MSNLAKEKPQSKVDFARERIKEIALRLGPGYKLNTVRELRQLLGFGTATIMSALGDLEKVGVIDRKLGSGLYVSQRIHQKTIGLIVSRHFTKASATPFYSTLSQLCEQRAKTHKDRFVFYINMSSTAEAGESLLGHENFVEDVECGRLHGLLRTYEMTAKEQAWLREKRVPMVGYVPGVHDAPELVDIDWAEMVRMGIQSLYAQGCRRIGLITYLGYLRHLKPPFEQDLQGYRQALDRLGLEFRPQWIWEHRDENWPDGDSESFGRWDEQGYAAVKSLYAKDRSGGGTDVDVPDGLVITNDLMTRGALIALRQLGLVVGRDIQVATHANKGSTTLNLCEEPMTLLELDPASIVDAMFVMLEKLMAGGEAPLEPVLIQPVMRNIHESQVIELKNELLITQRKGAMS